MNPIVRYVVALAILAAPLLLGCTTDDTTGSTEQQISGTPNDPWEDGVPTYEVVNSVPLPIVDRCSPPGPLGVITRAADTTSGSFEEIAIATARWPVLQRLPAHDQRWSYTGQTYTKADPTGSNKDGWCRSSYFSGTVHMLRRAWVWTQEFSVYNRNINLDLWYQMVSDWGDAGQDIAVDYLTSTDVLVDTELVKDIPKSVKLVELGLSEVPTPNDAMGVVDTVDTLIDGMELCSEAVEKSGLADQLKMVKLGVMTWGLTVEGITNLQAALGLLPGSQWYEGQRHYFLAASFDEAVKDNWTGELVYFGEEFPCEEPPSSYDFDALKQAQEGATTPGGE